MLPNIIGKLSSHYASQSSLSGFVSLSHIHTHVVVQSLSCVQLFATPWTAAHQAFLSITNSWSLLKLMSIETEMPSNHLDLCRPLLLPLILPSIRVFSELALCIKWPKCIHNLKSAFTSTMWVIGTGTVSLFWAPTFFSSFFFFFFWGREGSGSLTKRQSPNRREVFRIF